MRFKRAFSQNEQPFDIFISYKETDANGRRTQDSVLATDLYHQLTNQGFRVFLSRITLEDKLGVAYEPYIFAALNSAKVMVVLGTRAEHFNAVWVKNEWSRYLALVKQSGGKKVLIPAFRDMDPYDLPEEFSHLQAQDMSKLGFMQDLVRGIKKIMDAEAPKSVKETVVVQQRASAETAPLLKRAFMYLEDGDWQNADAYCERVLDADPENARAYLGKLMAELHCRREDELKYFGRPFDDKSNYKKAIRFGDAAIKKQLESYIDYINQRNLQSGYEEAVEMMNTAKDEAGFNLAAEAFGMLSGYKDADDKIKECHEKAAECHEKAENARKDAVYASAEAVIIHIKTEETYRKAEELFKSIPGWRDADERAADCLEKAEVARKDAVYASAEAAIKYIFKTEERYRKAEELFKSIPGWRDADERAMDCRKCIEELKADEKRRIEEARIAAEKAAKKRKKITTIVISAIILCITAIMVITKVIIPNSNYNNAVALMDRDVVKAYESLIMLKDYKDSAEKANSIFEKYMVEKLKSVNIGDYIYFGAYEQDNNTSNGKEDIEWLVLDKQDGKVLVISKYALDCQRYHTSKTDVTWESCSLRNWLNSTFIDNAFHAEEQAMIQTAAVSADENPEYSTNPGEETQDMVFLLSISEVEKYLKSDGDRICFATDYAKAQGAATSNSYSVVGKASCWWWLRSPGYGQDLAAYVNPGGGVIYWGNLISESNPVRPALWINPDS